METESKIFHAENAQKETVNNFISVRRDEQGRAVLTAIIQSDPVSLVGVNGCQAVDLLEYVKNLFISLNSVFPCRENYLTITKIEEALHWQEARSKDRIKRGVEGKNIN